MPVKPQPFKICCLKCGFYKIIQFSSDCLRLSDMKQIPEYCPKCGSKELENRKLTKMDKIILKIKYNFTNNPEYLLKDY